MPFQFKQFSIKQDKAAMKIGTDGVLLGAWCTVKNNSNSILDIGTGTGLIAMQLAQRTNVETIDAIEIEENAYEQAFNNFENSPWSDRLFCYHVSLAEFIEEIDERYDLIVANPPFYTDEFETDDKARNTSRFTTSLSFKELLYSVSKLLSENGFFSVIIPFKEESSFITLAGKENLFPIKITRVRGNINSQIKRSLIEFSFHKEIINISELIIEVKRHQYTKEYINLVSKFYLKM
jgi:tRNA1Val (adenine37-N6)-methyltransferase